MTQSGHRASLNDPHLNRYDAPVLSLGGGNETARVHHASRWRGCPVAALCARAAVGSGSDWISPRREGGGIWFLSRWAAKGTGRNGLVEGHNLTIEYAWTEGQSARLSTLATELVRRRVPVIVSSAINATLAAKVATSTIPIVFAVNTDPVALGLVASLNHPGGNLTGASYLSSELGAKRVGLMHEILPKVTDFGVLVHPTYPTSAPYIRDAEAAARSLGLRIEVFNASNEIEIDSAFAALSTRKLGGLLLANNTLFTTSRKHIVELTARYAMPTM